jgi:BMFP domain-containing protein YqiC
MTTTSSKFFDELAKLMSNAAGAAQGARKEFDSLVRAQLERSMAGMNIVQREEFEAVKDMAAKAREENERLQQRIAELEARLATTAPPRG